MKTKEFGIPTKSGVNPDRQRGFSFQKLRIPNSAFRIVVAIAAMTTTLGCQQKMATQPAPRPYEENSIFEFNQSARPLENGVVHRTQLGPDDPLVEWLTPQGKKVIPDPEWSKLIDTDGRTKTLLPAGAPTSIDNFVKEFPFPITSEHLQRGQYLFNTNCALCHGAQGDANGKIPERGVLRPPSYHRDPEGKVNDYSRMVINDATKQAEPSYLGNPRGSSRGFYRYGKVVYLDEIPVGYIFQVITWGYGAMGSHAIQVQDPADRWKVIAYIRALQLSKSASAAELSPELKQKLEAGEKK